MLRKVVFVALIVLLCASCVYFTRNTDPYDENYIALTFNGGKLWLSSGECQPLDSETEQIFKDWANRAWDDMHEAGHWPSTLGEGGKKVWVRGMKIADQGKYSTKQRLIIYRCDKPIVIRHELFHAWCYIDSMPCNCFLIDHPEGTKIEGCNA